MTYSGDRILLGSQRESRISRFRPWVLFVIPLIAILFNFYIPLFFHFLGFLDLPLLVTVYFALMRRSPIAGTFIGAFIGLAQDSLAKNPLGQYGIVKTLVGYFAASVGLRFDVDHPFIRLLLGFFFLLLPRIFLLGAGARPARTAGGLQPREHAGTGTSQRGGSAIPLSFPGQASRDDLTCN
jgi:rod shape-determining protein MreD